MKPATVNNRISKIIPPALLTLLIILPLISLCVSAGGYIASSKGQWLSILIPDARRLELLGRSVFLSLMTAVTGLLLGGAAAFWLLGRKKTSIPAAVAVTGIFLLIPQYVHAQAWIFLADKINLLLKQAHVANLNFTGAPASIWTTAVSLLPVPVCVTLIALSSIGREQVECGLLLSDNPKCFNKIILPQLLPAIAVSFNILFLLTVGDYGVPSVFAVNVYPMHIFSDFSANSDPGRAFISSLPLLAVTGLAAFSAAGMLGGGFYAHSCGGNDFIHLLKSPLMRLIIICGGIIYAAFVLVPAVNLLAESFPLDKARDIISSASNETFFTLQISFVSALVSLPFAYIAADRLNNSKHRIYWRCMIALPFVLPSSLAGIGLLSLFSSGVLPDVRGRIILPVLGLVFRFLPVAALIMFAMLRGEDKTQRDAAILLRPSFGAYLFKYKLPQLLPSLTAGFAAVFALSAGELGATLMLVPPGRNTLTMKIYNYLHYGASQTVAVLCAMMLCLVAVMLAVILFTISINGKGGGAGE